MVEIIGLGTMVALVCMLAWSMAGESESEKRRMAMSRERDRFAASATRIRHAA